MYWAYMYLLSRKWRNCLLLILLPKFHESKLSEKYMMLKWVTKNCEHFPSSMASPWMCLCNIIQEKLVHCQLSTTCLCNHILSCVTILHQEIVCISCPENLLNHSFECRNSCGKHLWENGELRIKYLKNKQMQKITPNKHRKKESMKDTKHNNEQQCNNTVYSCISLCPMHKLRSQMWGSPQEFRLVFRLKIFALALSFCSSGGTPYPIMFSCIKSSQGTKICTPIT